MNIEGLEKEATEFEENYTVYEVSQGEDGTEYAKKVCKVTVKEAYLAGAEPREKRIEELETENNKLLDVINNQDVKIAELEQKVEQTEKDLEDYQFNYPTIKELEKENAELKERYNRVDIIGYDALKNLTKAREIIKRLKSLIEDVCDINYLSKNNTKLLEETEQFLKEIEK